jgi:hypothetical protein
VQVTYGARTYYLTCDALAPGAALSPLLQAALATRTGKKADTKCADTAVVIKDIVRDGERFLRTDAASASEGEEEEDSADEGEDEEEGMDESDEEEEEEEADDEDGSAEEESDEEAEEEEEPVKADETPAALRARIAVLQAQLDATEAREAKRTRRS